MSEVARETAHLSRVFQRLKSEDARLAFFELLHRLYVIEKLNFRFLSYGNFSAVHLLFDPNGTPYGDAEFAFKGAEDHMRWWFRPPCFKHDLLRLDEISDILPTAIDRGNSDVVFDIRNCADVDQILKCVGMAGKRPSERHS